MNLIQRALWLHPEWSAAGVVVAAWLSLVVASMSATTVAGMNMPSALHEGGGAASGFNDWLLWPAAWLAMSAAMMAPPTLPTIRYLALTSMWHRRQRTVALFLASYLAVWMLFGLSAAATTALITHLTGLGVTPLAVTALVVAALWELTPWKKRALRACHALAPLPQRGGRADWACVRAGIRHAAWCMLGCWALMLGIATTSRIGVALMGVLTLFVLLQSIARRPAELSQVAAATMLALAAVIAAG